MPICSIYRFVRASSLLLIALISTLVSRAQSITLYPDFFATEYGVSILSSSHGQITGISEGGLWDTNCFEQSYTIDLSNYGEDTFTVILLDSGNDGGLSYEVNTTNLPFVCSGSCSAEMPNSGGASLFSFSLTSISGNPICTDPNACNYDPSATDSDGPCLFASSPCSSCMDQTVISNDSDGDGICDNDEILGCNDPSACNHQESATDNDGSCEYDSCRGCTDSAAQNYDPTASIENGACDYTNIVPPNNTCGTATTLHCGDTLIGSTGGATNLGAPNQILGCQPIPGAGVWYTFSGTGELHTVSLCGSTIDSRINVFSSNLVCAGGIPALFECVPALIYGEYASESGDCLNCGLENQDDPSVQFVTEVGTEYYAYVSSENSNGDLSTSTDGALQISMECTPLTGLCTDAHACNFVDALESPNLECDFSCYGCTDPLGCDYSDSATRPADCDYNSCYGCTDPSAINFESSASYDDGSCCESSYYLSLIVTGELNEPLSWSFLEASGYNNVSTPIASGGIGEYSFCLNEGCYTMVMSHSTPGIGNWNGAQYQLLNLADSTVLASGSLENADLIIGPNLGEDRIVLGEANCPVGCTDPTACNFSPSAVFDSGSCNFSCYGCTDFNATNFTPTASIDNGTCVYCSNDEVIVTLSMSDLGGDGWNGSVYHLYDMNGDVLSSGTLDQADTGDLLTNGADIFCAATGCTEVIISSGSQPGEIGWSIESNNNVIASGNGTSDFLIDIGQTGECQGSCQDPASCTYQPFLSDNSNCTYPPETYLDCDNQCLNDANNNGICDELDISGCTEPFACNYNAAATLNDSSCEYVSCTGCTDPEACNFDSEATINNGSCLYLGPILDCDGQCINDTDNDGVCDEEEIVGCQDPLACNYDALATESGTCTHPAEAYLDCEGDCLNDADGDGICDELEIPGCLDPSACNFESEATDDDGSCIPAGCMDLGACNYLAAAGCDDGNCDYSCCPGPGCCLDGTVWDYDSQGCIVANPTDVDLDGCAGVGDILAILANFGACFNIETEAEWMCGDTLEYWGYWYQTVEIGGQCWFAENLQTLEYQNGDVIPSDLSDSDWINTTSGAVATFDAPEYGRLYNWHAVNDTRNLCADGWHVPSDSDWMALEMTLGMSASSADSLGWRGTDEGTKLKSTLGWNNNGNGTDQFLFTAKPGGNRMHALGIFLEQGTDAIFWTSTPVAINNYAFSRSLNWSRTTIKRHDLGHGKNYGFSVRCVKD